MRNYYKICFNNCYFLISNPTPNQYPVDLKPMTKDHLSYLDITNAGSILGVNLRREFIQFWDDLYIKYEKIFADANLKKNCG